MSDPYMVASEKSDKSDDEDSSAVDDGPLNKKAKTTGGGFGAPSAEVELEAMLRAAGEGFSAGVGGKGQPGLFFTGGGDPFAGKGPPGKGPADDGPKVETTMMDFSKVNESEMPVSAIPVPKDLVETLMTPEHKQLLSEESGTLIEWNATGAQVLARGSTDQVKRATRLLSRIIMHCHWGKSQAKVKRLIRPPILESAKLHLSPMNTLRSAEKILSLANPVLTIGKDKSNDVVIMDPLLSRQHAILELDTERGAVYIIDMSTNGTYLNGLRLPAKTVGKVLLSHGDELLFKDPMAGDQEFGYMVNLQELGVKEQVKLVAPRRILAGEDLSYQGSRDFS